MKTVEDPFLAYRYKNLRKLEEVSTEYKGSKVYAFKWEYEVLNDKGREVTQREIVCNLYRVGSTNQPLNLGEMSDGSKFTAVAQAVNEAKWLVDYYLEKEVDRKLLSLGFLREDLFQYNRLRISERLQVKEKLLLDKDLLELKSKDKKEREDLELKEKFDELLPALEQEFNETVKVLIVGRFVVTKFHDKIESFLVY